MRIAVAKDTFSRNNIHSTQKELFGTFHCRAQRTGHLKKGAELFGDLPNVLFEENPEDEMVRENNKWRGS